MNILNPFSRLSQAVQRRPYKGLRQCIFGVYALAIFSVFVVLAPKLGAFQSEGPRSVFSKYTVVGEPRLLDEVKRKTELSSLVSFRPSNWSALTSEASYLAEMPSVSEHAGAPMSFMLSLEDLSSDQVADGEYLLPRLGVLSYTVANEGRFSFRGDVGRFLIGISPALPGRKESKAACRIVEGSIRVGFEESSIGGIVGYVREPVTDMVFGEWSWSDAEGVWSEFDGAGVTTSWGGIELMNRFSSGHEALQEASICIQDLELDRTATQFGLRRELLDSSTGESVGFAVVFLYFDCA